MPWDDANVRLCKAVKRKSRERCKAPAMRGQDVCRLHGGKAPQAMAKAEERLVTERVKSAMERFTTPIAADDPESNPITAFEMEFRRTVSRIRWLDEAIAELTEDALTWGRTKQEEVNATEFSGVNTTYEAGINALVALQMIERKHMMEMTKVWISTKLDERRLQLATKQHDAVQSAIVAVLKDLGVDIDSVKTKKALFTRFGALRQPEV